MMLMVMTILCTMVSVMFASFLLIDAHFERKEEKERQARKARQAEIARLMGE